MRYKMEIYCPVTFNNKIFFLIIYAGRREIFKKRRYPAVIGFYHFHYKNRILLLSFFSGL